MTTTTKPFSTELIDKVFGDLQTGDLPQVDASSYEECEGLPRSCWWHPGIFNLNKDCLWIATSWSQMRVMFLRDTREIYGADIFNRDTGEHQLELTSWEGLPAAMEALDKVDHQIAMADANFQL